MKHYRFLCAGLVLAIAGISQAQAVEIPEIGVGLSAGTLGGGLTLATPILEGDLNARALIAGISVDYEDSFDEVDADYQLDLFYAGALLDWYPFGDLFRFSGGLFHNGTDVTADGTCTQQGGCDVGGKQNALSQGDKVSGDIEFNSVAPYAGIGVGNSVALDGRFSFSLDVGVMFTGEGDVSLSCNEAQGATARPTGACDKAVAQEETELQDDVDSVSLYPVIMLGIGYRF